MSERKKIKVSKSILDKEEVGAVSRVMLEDGYIGMGQEVKKFEEELQSFLKTDMALTLVNTCTSALHLATLAVTEPGDEVLIQSLTYLASFQAISAAGAVPVACEVLPETLTIDLKDAEKKISSKTKAIMPVHYASDPGDLDSIYEFAKKHGLRVIEDAAHAFGSTYGGKLIGSFGDIVCFSFDPIKNITSIDGGAIVTGDKEIATCVRQGRVLGIPKDSEARDGGSRLYEFEVKSQGYRYHMSNVCAAVGRVQLGKFPIFKDARQKLAKRYLESLRGVSGVSIFEKNYDNIVPHIFPVRILDGKRDALKNYLGENGIETVVHYLPNHLLEYYRNDSYKLPVTEAIYSELLTLPLHPDVSLEDQDYIIDRISEFMKNA